MNTNTSIRFSEKNLKDINQRDLMSLTSALFSFHKIDTKSNVAINSFETIPDLVYPLMTTTVIHLQMWEEQEAGKGEVYEFRIHRAIDFGCSQSGFKLIKKHINLNKNENAAN